MCITKIRRMKLIEQGGSCYYCQFLMWDEGVPQFSGINFASGPPAALRCTAEHLVARCEGGSNAAANIVAACWFCNVRRHRRAKPLAPQAFQVFVRQRIARGKWNSNYAK